LLVGAVWAWWADEADGGIHRDASAPTKMKESTYVPYKATVNIPDVKCKKVRLGWLT
jgi:hypothetical protein